MVMFVMVIGDMVTSVHLLSLLLDVVEGKIIDFRAAVLASGCIIDIVVVIPGSASDNAFCITTVHSHARRQKGGSTVTTCYDHIVTICSIKWFADDCGCVCMCEGP